MNSLYCTLQFSCKSAMVSPSGILLFHHWQTIQYKTFTQILQFLPFPMNYFLCFSGQNSSISPFYTLQLFSHKKQITQVLPEIEHSSDQKIEWNDWIIFHLFWKRKTLNIAFCQNVQCGLKICAKVKIIILSRKGFLVPPTQKLHLFSHT